MKWSDEEIKVLEENQKLNSQELVELLPGRTYEGIVQKRNRLGLQWSGQLKWEDWETQVLENRRYYTAEEISEQFLPHRTPSSVRDRRNRVGLSQLVRCKDCGSSFVKNSQHDICSDCAKDHNYHNHSVLGKFRSYKHGATRRGYVWSITPEQFHSFWNAPRHYCGDEIQGVGIDRVDNTKGYVVDNCVPCCETCNEMKLDNGLEQWLSHMKKILRHMEVAQ